MKISGLDPIQIQCMTFALDYCIEGECDLYCQALRFTESFSFGKKELKLYFNDDKNYLRFKPIKPELK